MKLNIGTYNIQHDVRHRVRRVSGTLKRNFVDMTTVLPEVEP